MNMILKTAVSGALALAGSNAFATMTAPSTSSADLVLIVQNSTTNASYALDTGISIDTVLPNGSLIPSASLNTTLAGINQTITASTTLASFLVSNPASGDVWTLEGGYYPGTANNSDSTPGAAKAVFTSATLTTTNSNFAGKTLTNINAYLPGYNADYAGGTPVLAGLLTSTEITGSGLYTIGGQKKYNFVGAPDGDAVGTASQLFGMTGNGNTGHLESYLLGSVNLASNGTLTITGNTVSAVPIPAAVWLFGSGLMGLVGVSRRRKASV